MAIAANEITVAFDETLAEALTITKPANVANGNILVCFLTQGYDRAVTLPADWVLFTDCDIGTTAGQNLRSVVSYKIITDEGNEPADYTWTLASASTTLQGGIIRLSGVDTTTPVDCARAYTAGEDWNEATPCPTVTTATDDALVFSYMTIAKDIATPAEPASTTARIEDVECNGVVNNAHCMVASFVQAANGATPTRLWGFGTVDSGAEYHCITCAFRPAAAGDLSVDESDSVVVAESITAQLPLYENTESDSVVIAESITAQLPLYENTESDSVVVAESVTVMLPLYEVSVSDSVVVAESVTASLPLYEVSESESVVVAESVTGLLPLLEVSESESVVVAESVTALFPLFEVSTSDSVVVAESVTALLPLYEVVEYESVVVSENVIMGHSHLGISESDSVVIGEAVTAFLLSTIVGLPIISSQGVIHNKIFSGVIVKGHNK